MLPLLRCVQSQNIQWGGESHLVSSLAEGSKKAFTALYDKYMGMVYGYVVSIVKDSSLAEDITQQIFIQLWERRSTLDPEGNIPAYLYVAARNAVYKETRRQLLASRYEEYVISDKSFSVPDDAGKVDIGLIKKEVMKVIQSLPEMRRKIWVMKALQGKKTSEVAEFFNISPKTVDAQMSRVKIALRKSLAHLVSFNFFIFFKFF